MMFLVRNLFPKANVYIPLQKHDNLDLPTLFTKNKKPRLPTKGSATYTALQISSDDDNDYAHNYNDDVLDINDGNSYNGAWEIDNDNHSCSIKVNQLL